MAKKRAIKSKPKQGIDLQIDVDNSKRHVILAMPKLLNLLSNLRGSCQLCAVNLKPNLISILRRRNSN